MPRVARRRGLLQAAREQPARVRAVAARRRLVQIREDEAHRRGWFREYSGAGGFLLEAYECGAGSVSEPLVRAAAGDDCVRAAADVRRSASADICSSAATAAARTR